MVSFPLVIFEGDIFTNLYILQADVQKKFDDRERRRKEVHDRLVMETKKKGFMTPERKKALKVQLGLCVHF